MLGAETFIDAEKEAGDKKKLVTDEKLADAEI
jgi:hypothetical protein